MLVHFVDTPGRASNPYREAFDREVVGVDLKLGLNHKMLQDDIPAGMPFISFVPC